METRLHTLSATFSTTSTWIAASSLLMFSVAWDAATSMHFSDSVAGLVGPLARSIALLLVAARVSIHILSKPIRAAFALGLVGLAIWGFARELLLFGLDTNGLVPIDIILTMDAVLFVSLSIVAVSSFARSGLAPAPLRWIPAWILGLLSASWTLHAVATRMTRDPQAVIITESILHGAVVATQIGLGVVALLLAVHADRARPVGLS